jgi:alpha-1,4-galacturonosyltransferase
MRDQRKVERVSKLVQSNGSEVLTNSSQRRKEIDDNVFTKYSIWRQENDLESDTLIRLVKDQIIMARVYASIAHTQRLTDLQNELNSRIKECRSILEGATIDADLSRRYFFQQKSLLSLTPLLFFFTMLSLERISSSPS